MLRNPVKIMALIPLAYAPLIGIVVSKISYGLSLTTKLGAKITNLRMFHFTGRMILIVILLASVAAYNWPVLTGDLGVRNLRDDKFTVPPWYYAANEWIANHRPLGTISRTLWLPFDHQTQLWISTDYGSMRTLTEESAVLDDLKTRYINFILDALCRERTDRIGALLATVNVEFIVVALASEQEGKPHAERIYAYGDPIEFVRILDRQKDLRLAANETDFRIYHNEINLEHVAAFSRLFLVYTPEGRPAKSFEILLSLEKVPFFNVRSQLIAFEDSSSLNRVTQLSERPSTFLSIGDASFPFAIKDNTTLLSVYEAEQAFSAWSGYSQRISDITLSGGEALQLRGSGSIDGRFLAPRTGHYRIAFRALTGEGTRFFIDKQEISASVVGFQEEGLRWYESNRLFLLQGTHTLRIISERGSSVFDEMILIGGQDATLQSVFSEQEMVRPSVTFDMKSEVEYHVEANSSMPIFIVLSEFFNPSWNAYRKDTRLEHYAAFSWANAYYLPSDGKFDLRITFERQESRNLMVGFTCVLWVCLLAVLVTRPKFHLGKIRSRQDG